VSMFWKQILVEGLLDGSGVAKEINFVFDNCGGQNKNKMVLQFMVMLAKLNLAKIIHTIFLIKGHTKNDCDRLFNLLKYDYRKTNVYTPKQLLDCLTSIHRSLPFQWRPMRISLISMHVRMV
jgi:hypothetical protein